MRGSSDRDWGLFPYTVAYVGTGLVIRNLVTSVDTEFEELRDDWKSPERTAQLSAKYARARALTIAHEQSLKANQNLQGTHIPLAECVYNEPVLRSSVVGAAA